MKYIIVIIVFLLVACDNYQTVQKPEPDDLVPDTVATDDLVTDALDEPEGGADDDILSEIPNTLPDTTVASCGNGVVDEGEECDPADNKTEPCYRIDETIYSTGASAWCSKKWCIWDVYTCKAAEIKFDCPIGYTGEDCKKCASYYQDSDGNGTCEDACFADGAAFYLNGVVVECGEHSSANGRGCEYYKGKAICSCAEGWRRDSSGACTISE